jgi:hypothetical protein
MRWLELQWLGLVTACNFHHGRLGGVGDAGIVEDVAIVNPDGDTAVDAPPDACVTGCPLLASCKDILAANSAAASGVYMIDVDGPGSTAPFAVECDMTSMSGGWTLVGRERTGGSASAAGPLRYLGIDSNNATALANGTQSGIIAARFGGAYADVMITWGASYLRFAKPTGFDMFGNTVDTDVDVTGFATNESALNGWVTGAGGASLCVASRSTNVRPGDTSWAIKPRNDNNSECGCNDMAWAGRGAYYGGTSDGQQTSCTGWGGAWAGVKDDGVQKGGLAATVETRIWIR